MGIIIDFKSFKNTNPESSPSNSLHEQNDIINRNDQKQSISDQMSDVYYNIDLIKRICESSLDYAVEILETAGVPLDGHIFLRNPIKDITSDFIKDPLNFQGVYIDYWDKNATAYTLLAACNYEKSKNDDYRIEVTLSKSDKGYVYVYDFGNSKWLFQPSLLSKYIPVPYKREYSSHTSKGRIAQAVLNFIIPKDDNLEGGGYDDVIRETCRDYEPFETVLNTFPNSIRITYSGMLFLAEANGRQGSGIAIGTENGKYTINQLSHVYIGNGEVASIANKVGETENINDVYQIVKKYFIPIDYDKPAMLHIPVSVKTVLKYKGNGFLDPQKIMKNKTLTEEEVKNLEVFCNNHNALLNYKKTGDISFLP